MRAMPLNYQMLCENRNRNAEQLLLTSSEYLHQSADFMTSGAAEGPCATPETDP